MSFQGVMSRLARSLARRRFVLAPSPYREVDALVGRPECWRPTGCEPSLALKTSDTRLPRGWSRLSITMVVRPEDATLGWLHAEPGRQEEVVSIPVRSPANGRVEQFVRLPERVESLRYDPIKGRAEFTLATVSVQELGWPEVFVRQLLQYCRGEGLSPLQAVRAAADHVHVHGLAGLWAWMSRYVDGEQPDIGYRPWAQRHNAWTAEDLRLLEAKAAARLSHRPKFSIVMPVYNTPERWLREAIESVRAQSYHNWELCVCDDHSTAPHVWPLLEAFRKADPRVKTTRRSNNGHIARATNDAMSLMTGEYMCLMDHDDLLAPDALYEFARAVNEDPSVDLIYSDEDRVDLGSVPQDPIIKPAWSPEYLETHMYIGHFAGYRASIAKRIGGLREAFNGAQDYDFTLRFTEQTQRVRHIPKILYHWHSHLRSIAASIERKGYAVPAAAKALQDRLLREGRAGTVVEDRVRGWFRVSRDILEQPLVSIVLFRTPTPAAALQQASCPSESCAARVRAGSTYPNLEIVAAEEGVSGGVMRDEATGVLDPVRRLNAAADRARGDFLVSLSADTEVITEDWLENLLRLAQRPGMGAVGAKLLYRDRTLRHVGLTFVDGLPRYIRRGHPESDWGRSGSSAVPRNYLAVSGACMMIARAVFEETGGFDLSFAPSLHAVALCLSLVERGRRNALAPEAVLLRFGGDDPELHPPVDLARRFRARWGRLTTPDPYYGANLTLRPPNFEFQPSDERRGL